MRDLHEANITAAVIARLATAGDGRLRQILEGLVRHLHAFAREVRLTEQEWFDGIRFLTRTGQMCSDRRQEFILLSDTLGLSMLVVSMSHPTGRGETEQTVFGPFHRERAPRLDAGANIAEGIRGEPCFVAGRVQAPDGRPIAGATIDVWQADAEGLYDIQHADWTTMRLRAVFESDSDGRFRFRTVKPSSYPIPTDGTVGELLRRLGRHPYRPAHIHFMISAPGYDRMVTHVFPEGDPYLDSDVVFGVRSGLIAPFARHQPGTAPDGSAVTEAFFTLDYDFVLRPRAAADTAAEGGQSSWRRGLRAVD